MTSSPTEGRRHEWDVQNRENSFYSQLVAVGDTPCFWSQVPSQWQVSLVTRHHHSTRHLRLTPGPRISSVTKLMHDTVYGQVSMKIILPHGASTSSPQGSESDHFQQVRFHTESSTIVPRKRYRHKERPDTTTLSSWAHNTNSLESQYCVRGAVGEGCILGDCLANPLHRICLLENNRTTSHTI